MENRRLQCEHIDDAARRIYEREVREWMEMNPRQWFPLWQELSEDTKHSFRMRAQAGE